jgi:primary-amine oxidase
MLNIQAASIVRPQFPGHEPNFRVITLKEPLKKHMIPFLESQHASTASTKSPRPPREARVQVVIRGTDDDGGANQLFELIVDLTGDGSVVKKDHLNGRHSYIDSAYMQAVEAACMADPRIKAEIETLDLPPGSTVVVEPWAYATDGMIDVSQRTSMVSTSRTRSNHFTT